MINEEFKARARRWWVNFCNSIEIDRQNRKIKRAVPYNCYTCELLGICRDKQNRWKCRHGCMIMSNRKPK